MSTVAQVLDNSRGHTGFQVQPCKSNDFMIEAHASCSRIRVQQAKTNIVRHHIFQ
jgi:hypothetical protein